MLRDSRVYMDPDKSTRSLPATEGRVPEVDPSNVGVFGFGSGRSTHKVGRE